MTAGPNPSFKMRAILGPQSGVSSSGVLGGGASEQDASQLQTCQELNQELVDLRWTLLLDPMARSCQQDLLPQVWYRFFQTIKRRSAHRNDGISLPGYE